MKANRGTVWINAGLLLIAAALFLSAYNERESHEARDSAQQVIAQLCDALPTEADEAEPTTLPESQPDVRREMPVKTINGRDYIGVLSIPSLELELPVISQWDYPALKVAPCRYSGDPLLPLGKGGFLLPQSGQYIVTHSCLLVRRCIFFMAAGLVLPKNRLILY